ncbi:MAG: STAS domain-containing protein [Armatimonadota bacterium]
MLRLRGELCEETVEALRRELDLLIPMQHPGLLVSLAGCTRVDVDGIIALLDLARELYLRGRSLTLVTGGPQVAQLLHAVGIDQLLPTFPTEATAQRALRGGGEREPSAPTWQDARSETVARWEAIRRHLGESGSEDAATALAEMHSLCHRAETLHVAAGHSEGGPRCEGCPLFHALGGRAEDVGCRGLLDPIYEALRAHDRPAAVSLLDRALETVRTMPVPNGHAGTPGDALHSRDTDL